MKFEQKKASIWTRLEHDSDIDEFIYEQETECDTSHDSSER